LADATTKNLTDAQWQKMLVCEQGGMNEAMANLYASPATRTTSASRGVYHKVVLDPLSRGEDRLDGLHSNMQIPKVIGAARIYELTGTNTTPASPNSSGARGTASFVRHRRACRPRAFFPGDDLRSIFPRKRPRPVAPTTCSS